MHCCWYNWSNVVKGTSMSVQFIKNQNWYLNLLSMMLDYVTRQKTKIRRRWIYPPYLEVSGCCLYNGLLQIHDFALCLVSGGGGIPLVRVEEKHVVFPMLGSNLIVAHYLCGMQQERLCARGRCVNRRPMRYLQCNTKSYFIAPRRVLPRQKMLCISRLGWGHRLQSTVDFD